jgi:hypothetical protein
VVYRGAINDSHSPTAGDWSITIKREKKMGTMEVLLVSPLRPLHLAAMNIV